MRGRCLQLLRYLGLVMGLLGMLAGCGGNSGSSDTSGAVSRGRPLSLQLKRSSQLAPQATSASRSQGLAAAQVQQVQPGDPGFIERFEVRLQAQGSDLVPTQVFPLTPAEQDAATRDITVPDTAPATFQVLVSVFNSQEIEIFRGDTTVALGQTSAVVTLLRAALVPVPVTPANVQQTTFFFADGAIFGLAHMPVTLATGMFVGNKGDFALTANGSVVSGNLVIGSCTFVVTTSTFPAGQGLQVGDRIVLDPCQIDAIDRRLIVTNTLVSTTPSISSPPVLIPPDTTLSLPTPPPLVIDEDTSGSLQITASASGARPGTIVLGITIPPVHGTATLTSTGVLTYQPDANFNSSNGLSDRLVVTIVVSFTDNGFLALLLGTVPIDITVRPVNDAPVVTTPGDQAALEGAPVTLSIVASDIEGDALSFSATNLPPGLSINPTTGIISGTIASGAAVGSPYNTTITVSDGMVTISTAFLWTVLPPPVPINPGTVHIVSPSGPVPAGSSFSVPVVANTGAMNVLSYLFELTFDPTVVVVTQITQGLPLFEVPITNPVAFATGAVKFAANNPTFAPTHGVLTLATITFQVIGSPGTTSPLKLQFPSLANNGTGVLVDSNFQVIGGMTFVNGVVTVH